MRQPASPENPAPPAASPPVLEFGIEDGRPVVTLKPRGAARFGGAAFLSFWLCGWLLGEAFATVMLLGTLLATFAPGVLETLGVGGKFDGLANGAWFVVLFLAVWLTFWTFGGLAAIQELLRLVAASDRLSVAVGELHVDQRLGPFRSRQRVSAREIKGISVNSKGVLTAATTDGRLVLSALGTDEERRAAARWLKQQLAITRDDASREREVERQRGELPAGWESVAAEDGASVLLRRAAAVRRAWTRVLYGLAACAGTAVVAIVVPALRGDVPRGQLVATLPVLLLGTACVIGAVYAAAGGRVLAVFPGRVEVRRFVLDRWRVRSEPVSFLSLERSRDSDGDLQHRLLAHGARTVSVATTLQDPGDLLHLGRWLAARLSVRLDAPKDVVEGADD